MHYELNIGLDTANGAGTPASRAALADKALDLLRTANIAVFGTCIIGDLRGTEEPCLHAHIAGSGVEVKVGHVSEKLGQDCIALVDDDGKGVLVGPRAASWGDFNPELFRRPATVDA